MTEKNTETQDQTKTQEKAKKQLFRDDALDKLASPEQLDTRLVVVGHYGWLALLVLLVLLVFIGVWAFVGNLNTTVNGNGIILGKDGSLAVVAAPKAGRLLSYEVQVGDQVQAGQKVASIAQPELNQQLQDMERKRRELYFKWRGTMDNYAKREFRLKQVLDNRKRSLELAIEAGEKKLRVLEDMLESRQGLLKDGYIIPSRVQEVRDQIFSTVDAVNTARTQLRDIDLELLNVRTQKANEIDAIDSQILEVEAQIDSIELALEVGGVITASNSGRVLGLLASPGDIVFNGKPLLTMERGGASLQALIYVQATEGKQVHPGMEVQLSPTTHKKEEFGYIRGVVSYVSLFPTSQREMLKDLGDEQLVKQFSESGTPILVRVDFVLDPDTKSGLDWSSQKGADVEVTLGTILTASIIVRQRKPIELVIPKIRKFIGV